jgi:phosphoesterase, MJ0936 family
MLVVSDSHHDIRFLARVLRRFAAKVDLIAHLGDGPDDLWTAADALSLRLPRIESVRGNGDDSDPGLWPQRLIGSADKPILMLHGHNEGANEDMSRIVAAAERTGAKLVLFGHTHRVFMEEYRGVLAVNPGSISRPRDRSHPSFALVDAPDDPDRWFDVHFYEVGPGMGGIREIDLLA